MRKKRVFLFICIVMCMLGGCNTKPRLAAESSNAAAPGGDFMEKEPVIVKKIDIILLETFPVKVQVNIAGFVQDECTTIGVITSERNNAVFTVIIPAEKAAGKDCGKSASGKPFEKTIHLDVGNLPAGTYTVDVNGVLGTFTLSTDNKLTWSHSAPRGIS